VPDTEIIRRIVVALDASPTSLAALEAAAQIAALWKAEMVGLFIEDADLLRLASLPFVRELGSFSATPRPLDPTAVERQLRSLAARAEQAFLQTAHRRQVRAQFHVSRGRVVSELLATVGETDWLSLGKVGWTLTTRPGLGSTARAVVCSTQTPVIVFPARGQVGGPVGVAYDASPTAQRALGIARVLAGREHPRLSVLVVGATPHDRERAKQRAITELAPHGIPARYQPVPAARVSELARFATEAGVNTLVIPMGLPAVSEAALEHLAGEFHGPVVVVGDRRSSDPARTTPS
jgi:nucleotide-binding universal stress UspA family protein